MAPCELNRDLLRLYLDEKLPGEVARGIEAHSEGCPHCQAHFESILGGLPVASPPARASSPSSTAETRPQIEGYVIEAELGRGGMGVVYKATQPRLRRVVAIKMLLNGQDTPAARDRFAREARALAKLDHPAIVQIHDHGFAAAGPYLVLEFVQGTTLDRAIADYRDPRKAAALVETLARGVEAAHAAGIIHRDLKPENVLIGADGAPRIADFGIAKIVAGDDGAPSPTLTAADGFLGTPDWTSPEQVEGRRDVDGRADVHALGAILYALLTGRTPFEGRGTVEVLNAVRSTPPTPPSRYRADCPKDLEVIVLKALEKDPGLRFATAGAMAEELRRYLDGRTLTIRRVSRVEHLRRWATRNPIVATLSAGLALALVIGTIVSATLARQWRTQSILARSRQAESEERFRLIRGVTDEIVTSFGPLNSKDRPQLTQAERKSLADARTLYRNIDAVLSKQTDPEARAEVPHIRRRIGDLDRLLDGNGNAALAAYLVARRDQEARAKRVPNDRVNRRELGRTLHSLGLLLTAEKRWDEGEGVLNEALRVRERLAEESPEDPDARRDAAEAIAALGDLHDAAGRRDRAIAAFREAIDRLRPLADRPGDTSEDRYALLNGGRALAEALVEYKKPTEARSVYLDARKDGEALVAAHPDVADYRVTLALLEIEFGALIQDAGDFGDAENAYRKAVAHFEALARDPSPDDPYEQEADAAANHLDGLATAYRNRANAGANAGKLAEAIADFASYQSLMKSRLDSGRIDNPSVYREALAGVEVEIGDAYFNAEKLNESEAHYKEGMNAFEALARGSERGDELRRQADLAARRLDGVAAAHVANANKKAEANDFDGARPDFEAGVRLLDEQAARHPDNLNDRERVANVLTNWAARLWAARRFAEAAAPLRRAWELQGILVEARPDSKTYQNALQQTVQPLSQWAIQRGETAEAAALWRRMVDLESAAFRKKSDDLYIRNLLQNYFTLWLNSLILAQDREGLARGAEEIVAVFPDDPAAALTAAEVLAQAFRMARGDRSLNEDRRKGLMENHARRALTLLRTAVVRHFGDNPRSYDVTELENNPAIGLLRGRTDFDSFLAECRERAKGANRPLGKLRPPTPGGA